MEINNSRHSRRKYATAGIAMYPKAEPMKTPREQKTTLDFGLRISVPAGVTNKAVVKISLSQEQENIPFIAEVFICNYFAIAHNILRKCVISSTLSLVKPKVWAGA